MTSDTLRKQAGLVVMAGFRGLSAQPDSHVFQQVQELHLGGVILFDHDVPTNEPGRNIVGPTQLAELTTQLREASSQFLLIAVDQEGGQATRLGPQNGYPRFPSPAEMGEKFEAVETKLVAGQMARQLAGGGININFAPCVDLNLNPCNPIIGALGRAFSDDPHRVIEQARAFIEAHRENGLACTLKHFPGHGSSSADTHKQTVDVTGTFKDEELQPYRQLAGETDLVMIGHLLQRTFDPDLPASLSEKMINGLLREQIGFDGVVVTDDLGMAAVAKTYSLQQRVTLALNAGVDLLLFGNNLKYDPQLPSSVVDAIVAAVQAGDIKEDCLCQSVQRLDRLRWRLAGKQVQPQ